MLEVFRIEKEVEIDMGNLRWMAEYHTFAILT
jgi:hypothetical protein